MYQVILHNDLSYSYQYGQQKKRVGLAYYYPSSINLKKYCILKLINASFFVLATDTE